MDNLQTQIDNLKTLQESYDAIAQAAETYNTGKVELAANLTAKGVEASASESLPELAEKVASIQQETIEINGGEMFETQLYGAPTSVENVGGVYVQTGGSLWNLYEVMAQLKSDARFIGYGGILLAEYFKGYDTIQLINVGAGGAYFTCDGDLYFTDKGSGDPHVWHDNENGMMNRWVAYLFGGEGADYTIPSTNLCPRSIHIGRKVGTINCSVAGRIREIVVPDGTEQNPNVLTGTNFTSTQPWQQEVTLRNINHSQGYLFRENGSVVSIALDNCEITSPIIYNKCSSLTSIYLGPNVVLSGISGNNNYRILNYASSYREDYFTHPSYIYISEGVRWGNVGLIGSARDGSSNLGTLVIDGVKTLYSPLFSLESAWTSISYQNIYMDTIEVFSSNFFTTNVNNELFIDYLKKLSCKRAKRGLHLNYYKLYGLTELEDVIVGPYEVSLNLSKWNPTSVLSTAEGIAKINSNIRNHIAANVADGNNTLTFTVSTNLYSNLEQATLDAFAAKHWLVAGA